MRERGLAFVIIEKSDDVKAAFHIVDLIQGTVSKGNLFQLFLFGGGDGFFRKTAPVTPPCFDFHKDQSPLVIGDDIYLSSVQAEAFFDYPVFLFFEETEG